MSTSIYRPLKSISALFELLGESTTATEHLPAGPIPACILGFHAALAQWNKNNNDTNTVVEIVPVELSKLVQLVQAAAEKPTIPSSLSAPWRWIATCSWYRTSRSPAEQRYAWTRLAQRPVAIRLALTLGFYSTSTSSQRRRQAALIEKDGDQNQSYRLNHPLGCPGFASPTTTTTAAPSPDSLSSSLQPYTPQYVAELLEYRHALSLAHLIASRGARGGVVGGTESDTVPLILPHPISFTRIAPSSDSGGSCGDDDTPTLEISHVKALRKVVKVARSTINDMRIAHAHTRLDGGDDDENDEEEEHEDDNNREDKGKGTWSERLLAVLSIQTKLGRTSADSSSSIIWAMLELDSARARARLFISPAAFRAARHDVAAVAEQVVGQVSLALNDGEMPRLGYAVHITSMARLVNQLDSDLANSTTGPLAMRILDKFARMSYHDDQQQQQQQSDYPGSLCASFDMHVESSIRAKQKAWITDDIERQGMLYNSLVSGSALDALLQI